MAIPETTELALRIHLSRKAQAMLAQKAAEKGQDVGEFASALIEEAVTRPSIDEILKPFRDQVAQSGMSDEELDAFHESLLKEVRAEKRQGSIQ